MTFQSRRFVTARLALVSSAGALCLLAAEEPYRQTFETTEMGEPPNELFVIEGEFEVLEVDGNRCIKLSPTPLAECAFLFAKSGKGAMTAGAKILASKRGRRSFPRFGLGVHGISGYRLRAVPAKQLVELVKDEAVVKTAPFTWRSGHWCHLKLSVTPIDNEKYSLKAWIWMEGDRMPEKALFEETFDGPPGQGKASVWGTPYSGTPIYFDDLTSS